MVQDLPLVLCPPSDASAGLRQRDKIQRGKTSVVSVVAAGPVQCHTVPLSDRARHRLRSCIPILALVLSASALASPALARNDPPTANGYYTTAQAQAGQATFDQTCAVCHGDKLQGKTGPALTGQQFLSVSQFQQVTAYYFYHFMSKHMPLNAPGSLTKTQYLDLLAFLLQANGYASGSHSLSADSAELKSIKIQPQH